MPINWNNVLNVLGQAGRGIRRGVRRNGRDIAIFAGIGLALYGCVKGCSYSAVKIAPETYHEITDNSAIRPDCMDMGRAGKDCNYFRLGNNKLYKAVPRQNGLDVIEVDERNITMEKVDGQLYVHSGSDVLPANPEQEMGTECRNYGSDVICGIVTYAEDKDVFFIPDIKSGRLEKLIRVDNQNYLIERVNGRLRLKPK